MNCAKKNIFLKRPRLYIHLSAIFFLMATEFGKSIDTTTKNQKYILDEYEN